MFKNEYDLLGEQFNKVRYQLMKYERIQKENLGRTTTLEMLNSQKDIFYDTNAIRFIDLLPGYKMVDMEHLNIREEDV